MTWVDIDGGTLHVARQRGSRWTASTVQVGAPLAGAVRWHGRDTWLVAVGTDLAEWHPGSGLRRLCTLISRASASALRLNEMVTDPLGRVWVGSMAYDWAPGAGSVYRLDLDGSIHRVIDRVTIANGIGFSPDATTAYTTDTGEGEITAWDYDLGHGAISRPRTFIRARRATGRPDGLAVDSDGNVWSAFAGAHVVRCFDPAGQERHREPVPAPMPTSLCFAGERRDRLVITTGRKRLTLSELDTYPDSGRVWSTPGLGVTGLAQEPFRGDDVQDLLHQPSISCPQASDRRSGRNP